MIDTIHIRINFLSELIQGKDYIQGLLNVMTLIEEGIKHRTGNRYYSGTFRNLIIEIDGNNVSIKGSLAKYYQGNNVEFLNRTELYRAIKLLSTELGMNIERGRISRIDIADNLLLKHAPKNYMALLIGIGKAEAYYRKKTLYIDRSCSGCLFYDKAKELDKNDPSSLYTLKSGHPELNVLRYEVRFERKLAHQFGFKVVKVALLNSTTFYRKLAEAWVNHYHKIEKIREEVCAEILSPSEFKKLVLFKGIDALGGYNNVSKLVDMMRAKDGWGYPPAYKLKQFLKACANAPFLVEESPLIQELDDGIANSNIVKEYLNN